MSSPGFKRWGATTGASSASSYSHSRADGTQYVSPSEEKKKVKKPEKKVEKKPEKKPEKEKSAPSPKPGKAAIAYSGPSPSSSPKPVSSSPKPAAKASHAEPEIVKGGLNSTTYEKQPDWAFSERSKNASGQYRDGMFQGSSNTSSTTPPPVSSSPKPTASASSPKPTSSSSSTSQPGWAQKPVASTFSKPATSSSPKPAVASYKVGGGSATSSYGSSTGTTRTEDSGVVKSSLPSATYEKQPDWAYAERSKNANGQYKDGMFQKNSSTVSYGSGNQSPSQLRSGGHLR